MGGYNLADVQGRALHNNLKTLGLHMGTLYHTFAKAWWATCHVLFNLTFLGCEKHKSLNKFLLSVLYFMKS